MPAIEQHRRAAFGGGKLQAAGGGLVGRLHFGDDAGERAVAQAVLGEREHLAVLAPLGIEDALGTKPDLLEAGRVKIEPGQRPQNGGPRASETGGDACDEQRRGGIIAQSGRDCGDFVQPCPVEPMIGEAFIERVEPECEDRAARRLGMRDLGAKRGKLLGAGPIGRGRKA